MSSIRASASTIIEREIHDVFAYLLEISTMEDWVIGVSDVSLISGIGGSVGDIYEYDYTYGGRIVPMRVEITALDPRDASQCGWSRDRFRSKGI